MQALLFNDTSYEKHHGSQLVVRQIHALAREAGINIRRSCPMRYDWRKDEVLKRDIRAADLCLINGEGTMHDDAKQALILGELASYCKEHGVPCFLINSVWQNNRKLLAHAADFAGIYLRDEMSQRELLAQGVSAKVVPDLTLSYVYKGAGVPSRDGFLVNDSVFSERTCEAWRETCDVGDASVRFLSIKNIPVIQVGKGFPRYVVKSCARYLQSLKELLLSYFQSYSPVLAPEHLGAFRWRYSQLGLNRFMHRLASARGVITGRFHCVTLCFLARTPFYAIGSNTHKIQSLLMEAGLVGRVYETYGDAIRARSSIDYSASELSALDDFLQACQARARAMFSEIFEVAQARKQHVRALGS